MPDLIDSLRKMQRPRLLIRAARHGCVDYNRNRDLKRVLRQEALPAPHRALRRLMDMEADLNQTRRAGEGGYSVGRHVDILIALMGEAKLLTTTMEPCG